MYGAVCFPEIERNQSFCDKEQRFLTKCMPVYDDEGDYENPQPTKWPHFDRDTESGHRISNYRRLSLLTISLLQRNLSV